MDTGVEFRSLRESRGLTIDAIAAATRIAPRMIEAVERNDLGALPPRPYARGFVAAYGRELGLDPNEVVTRYFAQFQPPPAAVAAAAAHADDTHELDRSPLRSRAVVAALVVAALAGILISRRHPAVSVEQGAKGTAGVAPVPIATDSPRRDAAPLAAATPRSAQSPGEFVILLTFDGRSWVTASADGSRVLYRMMETGTTETLRGRREITMRLGDAGVVRWSVNGRPAAVAGRPGEVRTITVGANSPAAAR